MFNTKRGACRGDDALQTANREVPMDMNVAGNAVRPGGALADKASESSYRTVTSLGDFGPWVSKLILELPCKVARSEVSAASFNVFCRRHELADGATLMRTERGADHAAPSEGYVPVLAAYPCDAEGAPVPRASCVALELPETRLTKRIEGTVLHWRCIENRFRVTQLDPFAGEADSVCGLVFTRCAGDVCPALAGWETGRAERETDGMRLEYGYFTPACLGDHGAQEPGAADGGTLPAQGRSKKAPLVVWLHGAGEGGDEVVRAVVGNRVTALSQASVQRFFGGAAWVLVPQCPTFWMDDGEKQLGRVNESIYVRPLKALIDEFVAAHAEQIDPDRIVIGGLSNGGFMTVRMVGDYPGFFCAGIPVCAPFFEENQTDEVVGRIARTPLWFVHAKGDELVDPRETSLPLYARLRAVGAEVHMTYFDHVEDLTGVYREPDGRPKRTFNHGVWIHVYNDFCHTDLDGTNVVVDGEPVGCWEWAARKRLA